MRRGSSLSPIERLRLMAEDITGFLRLGDAHSNGKRVICVIGRSCHWDANHKRCCCVEVLRRQHHERVYITHLSARLRIAVNPNNVLPTWNPVRLVHYSQTSAPTD